jgi:hypothetical protein
MSKTIALSSLLVSVVLLVTLVPCGRATLQLPSASSEGICPPLPAPTGTIVDVSNVAELLNAVHNATSDTTIRIADGTYELHGDYLWIDTPGMTLRSASGNREAVVIDGNYETGEIVHIAASDVTVADLTLKRAYYHPIHVSPPDDADIANTLIYNVHIIDPGQQAIKINPNGERTHFPDDGVIACSLIELTDAGRPHVWWINDEECYTGGVDAHQAQGWVIRDNVIEGFWCPGNGGGCAVEDLAEHAIHFWAGSRDTIVERNVLIDNARGVGFGLLSSGSGRTYGDNPCPGASGYVGHFDGIVRNNFVVASRGALFSSDCGFDCGICLAQACGAQVLHNSVVSTNTPFSSIEWRFPNTDAAITNNLVSHDLLERDGASATLAGNLAGASLSLFVDGAGGDLHLVGSASPAIDTGVAIAGGLCDDDIDGDLRGFARDIGADEYGAPPPAAVTDLRVAHAVADSSALTTTLEWTAPTGAFTTTLRYADSLITKANWDAASLIIDTLSGSVESYTAAVPYGGGTVYFALRSQNTDGAWSALSNNAFWPHWDIFLPLVAKDG